MSEKSKKQKKQKQKESKASQQVTQNFETSSAIRDDCLLKSQSNSIPGFTGYLIGKISEAPKYLHDNEFIEKGYRIGFNSMKKVIKRY